jgi:hypothetical protein
MPEPTVIVRMKEDGIADAMRERGVVRLPSRPEASPLCSSERRSMPSTISFAFPVLLPEVC